MKKLRSADRWSPNTAEPRTWISLIGEQVSKHWLRFYKHRDILTITSPSNPA